MNAATDAPETLYQALFTGLWDDAALFPPGNAPMAEAVPAHRLYRAEWFAPFVRNFLVGAAHVPDLLALADPDAPLRIVLVAPGGPATVGTAVRTILDTPGLFLEGIEVAGDGEIGKAVAALHEHLPEMTAGYVEVLKGAGLDADLDNLAGTYGRPKFRTGGTAAHAFPDEAELAAFVYACRIRELPFKVTAGLHNAVRHTDPTTGFEHHGYLNLMLATHHAVAGAEPDAIADVLALRDSAELTRMAHDLTLTERTRLRGYLTSYGTCSVAEPLQDALTLGLLGEPPHHRD
ncbi:hypothetical protein [Embleya scabrispora]|uniref:hypothetical protein n=1 Tax=Embleya scabrispora TaxID=159449 RepID=UPI0007C5096B|nr:hypothetical protein [Embleya scabrispora]MYS78707.1 hypothetical protein [Streptomyces sp. SID5474]